MSVFGTPLIVFLIYVVAMLQISWVTSAVYRRPFPPQLSECVRATWPIMVATALVAFIAALVVNGFV